LNVLDVFSKNKRKNQFNKNPSMESAVVPCGRKNSQDEVNSWYS